LLIFAYFMVTDDVLSSFIGPFPAVVQQYKEMQTAEGAAADLSRWVNWA
jgi:hypothetical protein